MYIINLTVNALDTDQEIQC